MPAPHTFELTLDVDNETFRKWRDKVKNKKKYNKDREKDYSLTEHGVTVWYPKKEFKKAIKVIVNPSRLLGFDDVVYLWEPKKKNIAEMLLELEKHINDYFDSDYDIGDFRLTRFDVTSDLRLGYNDKVAAHIKVLYNIRKVKGFSPKYDKDDEDWYDTALSFDLIGNSNGIEFTAYDKESVLKLNKSELRRKDMEKRIWRSEGVLRCEVKLTTQKAIRTYTDEDDTVKRIIELSEKSSRIFSNTFCTVVPYGDLYKKEQAVEIIEEKVPDKKMRAKMIKLLELIPVKKSLYLAIKEMNDRKIRHILSAFMSIGVSPVTISKRQNNKHLRSLYKYVT